MTDKKYRDKNWLRTEYLEKEKTMKEISEMCGVCQATIKKYLDRYDISRFKPWEDKETLEYLYNEKGLLQSEVAERLGTSPTTVHENMVRHRIERSKQNRNRELYFDIHRSGYFEWQFQDKQKTIHVREHRLLAVAEFGFEAVKNKIVHHKNHMKMDNRRENLELMSRSDHMTYHNNHPGFKNDSEN